MKTGSKKSFGLIETLIACAILIIIAGAVLMINVVLNNNIQFTRERAHAYYRAVETIEAIRNIRDTNYIDGIADTNWNSFVCDNSLGEFTPPVIDNDNIRYAVKLGCNIGGQQNRFFVFPGDGNVWSSHGVNYLVYVKFRSSGINPEISGGHTADNSIKAVVTVEWNSRGRTRSVELREVLTNWRQSL
jgi:hypothetical protein